jgi:hypothetical protein
MLMFKDLIYEKQDAITKQECAEFIKWFWSNTDLHVQGKVYGGVDASSLSNTVNLDRKNTTQAYPKPEDPISDTITKIIFSGYDEYASKLPVPQGQPLCTTTYSIRVYRKGEGKFLEHVDQSAGPNVTRIFGVILYLNTVDDGGETDFLDYNLKIKPEAGKLLIFPCNYLYRHQGNIPISDDKYIVTAFINFADV